MLIQEGDKRTPATDLMLASILAFVAGGVNSAGYFGYRYFSANMTGNVSMASDLFAVSQSDLALGFLTIVAMFIFGAFIASILIEFGKRQQRSNIYALTLIIEAAFLIFVGLVISLSTRPPHGVLVVGLLSLTMGLQNAASTRISGSRVRTTHVSGIATDIGVGIAMLLGGNSSTEKLAIVLRLKLHFATIVFFALGGVLGVLGCQHLGGLSFCALAMPLILLSLRYLR
ncbi:YoaK family protein [Shinella zoogloeoides]|uniref:YoaK family protein n=1 Tax=Shinella zoogloeoides TaxID=352475 RepID=UPI000E653359|nr:YoaK family protein [Shinella zoogloeoides]WPE22866.1 hypothetical protein ShzoTeo12_40840 [Shinella zoogloeoides]